MKNNKQLKITFVLDHFYPHIGGAEILFYNLINELSKDKKLKITVITSDSGGVRGVRKINNYTVVYCPWKIVFGHPIINIFQLFKYIRDTDIVHTATYTAGFFSFLVSFLLRKKIVITVYENLFFDWFKIDSFFKAIIYFIFEFFTVHLPFSKYLAISKSTKNNLTKSLIDPNKIDIIYPFIEGDLKCKKTKIKFKSNYFLFFGRPGKTKGIFILLKAIDFIKDKIPKDYQFLLIISDDPKIEKQKVITFVNNKKLQNLIKILPSQEKEILNFYIKNASCVIVPSLTEGFGFSAYESVQLGTPVIVSDAGSLPEIVSGKYIIFKSGDYKDLAKKIIDATKGEFKSKKIFTVDKNKEIQKLKKIYFSL
jgi:glycosyltransferase involved in cell wall biosynthesis